MFNFSSNSLALLFSCCSFQTNFSYVSNIKSTRSNLVISFLIASEKKCSQHGLWTFLDFKMFTRTDLSKTADWLIGYVVEKFLSSLRQGSRSALLPERISPFFVNTGDSRLVSCSKSSCTSIILTWAAINSWANSFLSLFNSFFSLFLLFCWDKILFLDGNNDRLFFLIGPSLSFALVTNLY